MAKPTLAQVHIDAALTRISIAYTPGEFIAGRVFPALSVQKISDKYYVYTKADWLRREAAVRAPGTRAARGDYGTTTSTYRALERAVAKQVPDEIIENADPSVNPLEDAVRWTVTQLALEVENDVADLVFGTTWSASATPATVWSNDTSDPLGDVETAQNSVTSTIGREANKGVMGRGVWRYAKNHPDIVDRIKYSAGPNSPAAVTLLAVAALTGLDEILVGRSIEDTAAEGATSSLAYLWGSHMAVMYVTRTPSMLDPSAGYIFNYKTRETSRFREDQERSTVVETRQSWDASIVASDAGYLIKSPV